MEQKGGFLQKVQGGSYKLTRLLLIRHGEVENATDGIFRYNGHIDVGLSRKGEMQMESLGRFLKEKLGVEGIKKVYTSDLKRARRSGEIIARYLGAEVESYKELRELAQGIWEGLTLKEVFERYPEEAKRKFSDFVNYRVPGGENVIDGEKRVFPLFWRIFEENMGRPFAIVAHGGINSIIISKLIGIPYECILRMRLDYGSLCIIDFYDRDPILRLYNASTYSGTIP